MPHLAEFALICFVLPDMSESLKLTVAKNIFDKLWLLTQTKSKYIN